MYLLEGLLSKLRYQKISGIIKDQKIILEIGCGPDAYFLKTLLPLGKKVIGFDPKLKSSYSGKNIDLYKTTVTDKIDLASESVDAAVLLAVLEHLEKPEKIIGEIFRVLKPGGILCLTTPTPKAKKVLEFLSYKLKIVDPAQIREHKNYFSKADLENLVRQNGFFDFFHQYFQFGHNNFFVAKK